MSYGGATGELRVSYGLFFFFFFFFFFYACHHRYHHHHHHRLKPDPRVPHLRVVRLMRAGFRPLPRLRHRLPPHIELVAPGTRQVALVQLFFAHRAVEVHDFDERLRVFMSIRASDVGENDDA